MIQSSRLRELFAWLLLCLAGCQRAEKEPTRLIVTGSPGLAPLMEQIAGRFEGEHAGVRIRVERSSSAEAVTATQAGLADVGMMARPLQPGEAGLEYVVLARDGVA